MEMAYRIVQSELPPREDQVKMIKELTVREKKHPHIKTFQSKSLKVYGVSNNYLHLPYIYASIYKGKSILNLTIHNQIDLTFKGELRDKQLKPIEEATSYLKRFGTTTLHIRPGFGKTMLSCYLSCAFKEKTLVVHTFKALNSQWKKTFTMCSNAKVAIVGEDKAEEVNDANVLICMDRRLSKVPKELLASFQFLIIDECHTWCTQIRINSLMELQPRHIIAASATFDKEDGLSKAIEMIVGPHRVRVEYDDPLKIVRYNTGVRPPIKSTSVGVDNAALRSSLMKNPARNRMILDLVKKYKDNKVLILTWQAKHVEILEELLKFENISVSSYYGDKKNYVDSDVLVGTIQKMGTGFDPELNCVSFCGVKINTIILALSVKNVGLFEQIFGRAFRTEDIPLLIYMVDDNTIVKRHWGSCKKWIDDHNSELTIETTEIEVTDEDYKAAEEAVIVEEELVEEESDENEEAD